MAALRERAVLTRGRSRGETRDSPRARHRQVYEIARRHCFVIPLLRYFLYFFIIPLVRRDLGVAIRETHAGPLITKPFDTPPASLARRYMHAARARREFASVIKLRSSRLANKTYVDVGMTIIVREGPRTSDFLSGELIRHFVYERDGEEDHLVYLRNPCRKDFLG